MPTPFSGGCLCGAIRYECVAEPVLTLNCHCRDCQRSSGSPFAAIAAVPKPALRITRGEAKYHEVQAESGNTVARGFCAECGSPLFVKLSGFPDIVGIRAVSLDDPSWFRPAMDLFTTSAQPWDYMDPAVTKLPKGPQP